MNDIKNDFIVSDVSLNEFLSILEVNKPIEIYTDGSCRGNPGSGGWGAILVFKNKRTVLSGYEEETTNNRMELTAAIKALSVIPKDVSVIVYTDSSYVKNGITEWLQNWKLNSWKTADNKPVKNIDLWKQLDKASSDRNIRWTWVKGHSDCLNNNNADYIAKSAIEEGQKSIEQSFSKGSVVYRIDE